MIKLTGCSEDICPLCEESGEESGDARIYFFDESPDSGRVSFFCSCGLGVEVPWRKENETETRASARMDALMSELRRIAESIVDSADIEELRLQSDIPPPTVVKNGIRIWKIGYLPESISLLEG